jgi:hypothetical protein
VKKIVIGLTLMMLVCVSMVSADTFKGPIGSTITGSVAIVNGEYIGTVSWTGMDIAIVRQYSNPPLDIKPVGNSASMKLMDGDSLQVLNAKGEFLLIDKDISPSPYAFPRIKGFQIDTINPGGCKLRFPPPKN